MTCSAGGGNVGVIHPGLGIACRQQLVRAAVAIHTGGSLPVPGLDCLGVIAAVVSRLLIGMALCTVDLGGRGLVGRTFDVGVAVDAGEDAPVHRVLECIGVYVKADLLTICLLSHRRIAVAYEAVFVRGFGSCILGGEGGKSDKYQTEKSNLPHYSNPAYGLPLRYPHLLTASSG